MMSPERRRTRSRIAYLTMQINKHPDDQTLRDDLEDARRDYAFHTLEQRIQETVSTTQLTHQQVLRIVAVLQGAS